MMVFADFNTSLLAEAIGWTVLHSLWQGTLVLVLLKLCLKVLGIQNARQRYWLSLSSLALICAWSLHTFNTYDRSSDLDGYTIGEPVTMLRFTTGTHPLIEKTSIVHSLQSKWKTTVGHLHAYTTEITLLWFLGAFVFTLRLLGGLLWVHRIRRHHCLPAEAHFSETFHRLSERFSLYKPISLLVSPKVDVPMTIGYLKPIVLVPAGLLTGMEPWQVESIMAHEIAHIQRNDFLINIIQSIAEVIFFFHPAVWFISKSIRNEREHCCDDLAIAATAYDSLTYAKALSSLEQLNFNNNNNIAMQIGNTKNHLLLRVKRLLEPTVQRPKGHERSISILLLFFTILSVSWYVEKAEAKLIDPATLLANLTAPKDAISPILQDTTEEGSTKEERVVPSKETPEIVEGIAPREDSPLEQEPEKYPEPLESQQRTTILSIGKNGKVHKEVISEDFTVLMGSKGEVLPMTERVFALALDLEDIEDLKDITIVEGKGFQQFRYIPDPDDFSLNFDSDFDLNSDHPQVLALNDTLIDKETLEAFKASLEKYKRNLHQLQEDLRRSYADIAEKLQIEQGEQQEVRMEMREEMKEKIKQQVERSQKLAERNREYLEEHRKAREKVRKQAEMNRARAHARVAEMRKARAENKRQLMEQRSRFKSLEKELIKDGYLKKGDKIKKLIKTEDSLKINGKKIKDKDKEKYKYFIYV